MARKNSADVAAKWQKNTAASTQEVIKGVDAVTESPTTSAAAAQDKYLQGVQDSVNSGKYRRGLMRVSLQDWQDAMKKKGVQRISAGTQAAIPKMTAFLDEFLPFVYNLQDRIKGMPNLTKEDARARMNANFDGLANFKRSR